MEGRDAAASLPTRDRVSDQITLTDEELELLKKNGACRRCKQMPAPEFGLLCDLCDEWATPWDRGECDGGTDRDDDPRDDSED